MDACSGLEAFCRGEEDGLLSVKKVRFAGGRYISIRSLKEPRAHNFFFRHLRTKTFFLSFQWGGGGYEDPIPLPLRPIIYYANNPILNAS